MASATQGVSDQATLSSTANEEVVAAQPAPNQEATQDPLVMQIIVRRDLLNVGIRMISSSLMIFL